MHQPNWSMLAMTRSKKVRRKTLWCKGKIPILVQWIATEIIGRGAESRCCQIWDGRKKKGASARSDVRLRQRQNYKLWSNELLPVSTTPLATLVPKAVSRSTQDLLPGQARRFRFNRQWCRPCHWRSDTCILVAWRVAETHHIFSAFQTDKGKFY